MSDAPESEREHNEHIAELEAQIAALESLLARRSREIRVLQQSLSPRALASLSRIQAGLRPLPSGPFAPWSWRERHTMQPARVLPILRALWQATGRSAADGPLLEGFEAETPPADD